jgi:hypothetical protein
MSLNCPKGEGLGAALWPERQNLYAYVGNNPVNFVDPTGEVWQRAAVTLVWKYGKQAASWTWNKGKQAWEWTRKNVKWDGPSPGFAYDQGRFCQLRVKDKVIFRADKHSRRPGGPPEWHVHVLPKSGGEHGFTVPWW